MSTVCLGVDPGGTTGWVLLGGPIYVLRYGEAKSAEEVVQVVSEANVVVLETFRPRPSKAGGIAGRRVRSAEVAGQVEARANELGVKVYYQEPSTVKPFFSDALLRHLGVYLKGRHARDALRHALYWYWFVYGAQREEVVRQALLRWARKED